MNSNLTEILQQGLRIILGGVTVLSETLQDQQKRTQTLDELQSQLKQKAEELSQRGEVAEREVRIKAEQWLGKSQSENFSTVVTTPTTRGSATKEGVEELTVAIIALRQELENSRSSMI